mgnify:FL=1
MLFRSVIVGEIEDFVPPRRLVHRFGAQWSPEVAVDRPSRVTWEITPLDATTCRVTVVHDDFDGDTATNRAIGGGWPVTLSRLKTLVETGRPLAMPSAA